MDISPDEIRFARLADKRNYSGIPYYETDEGLRHTASAESCGVKFSKIGVSNYQPSYPWPQPNLWGPDLVERDRARKLFELWAERNINDPIISEAFLIESARVFSGGVYVESQTGLLPLYETFRPSERVFQKPLNQNDLALPHRQYSDPDWVYLYLSAVGCSNYGHWLIDSLPKVLAINSLPYDNVKIIYTKYGHSLDQVKEESIRAYMPKDRNIVIEGVPHNHLCQINRLVYISPISRHPIRKSRYYVDYLRKFHPSKSENRGKRIFVVRPDSVTRRLTNQDEVKAFLETQGFKCIEPGQMSFSEQIETFSSADTVVGTMGAAMTNTLFCQSKTNVLYLKPSGWDEPFYWDLAAISDHNYHEVICDSSYETAAAQGDFQVDLGCLKEALSTVTP